MVQILLSENRIALQALLVVIICSAAFLKGGGPERAFAMTWILLFEVVQRGYKALGKESWQFAQTDMFLASVDILAAVIFTVLAVNANRIYPLWIAGLQVLALTAHLARGMTDLISPIAYAVMVTIPGWLQLIILGSGIVLHRRRERQFGPYRAWRIPVRFGGLLPTTGERT